MPETDGVEKVAEAVQRVVFDAGSLAGLGNTIGNKWVPVPEWRNRSEDGTLGPIPQVCVWGTTIIDRMRIESDVTLGERDEQKALRRQVATIIECVRDGEASGASLIFNRAAHWGWLEKQPASVLDRLFIAVLELDKITDVASAEMDAFFAPPRTQTCLTRIASACGACTSCPENCPQAQPQQTSASPEQPTE
ncbi:MAG: hypothetical protein WC998_06005 [Candidatus Paceibacterota bacterium]|jgi:hypothetical protein